jgi:hypothetical protein
VSTSPADFSCPSAPAVEGRSALLGIVGRDGRLVYTASSPQVTAELLGALTADGHRPEAVARFSGRCVNSGCAFWVDDACRAIDVAHSQLDTHLPPPHSAELPECGIRPTCRWWAQEGPSACRVCAYVTTAAPVSIR